MLNRWSHGIMTGGLFLAMRLVLFIYPLLNP